MSLLKAKFIPADLIDGSKIKLNNAETLRARNFANSADIALFSLTASDKLVFNIQPEYAADPTLADHLTRYSWVNTQLGTKQSTSEKGAANGYAGLDANSFVPLVNIPPTALERLVIVADQTARFALTTATVQNGDTVKQVDTNVLYFVKDDTNLGNVAGYEVYSAGTASSVAWSGVTGTPTTVAGYGITDIASDTAFGVGWNGEVAIPPSKNAVYDEMILKAALTDLASTANGKGASLIGIEDAAAKFTATTIEAALLELYNKAPNMGREVITLIAGDITNGYVELAQPAVANSLQVTPKGGLLQEPGVDFTESIVVTNTRITFAGDLLTLLATGDKLICYYVY